MNTLARVISAAGHPLLTSALFLAAVMGRQFPSANGPAVVALLVVGVLLPIAGWNLWQVRQGNYTNFDVSHRPQRVTMYPLIVGLLAAVTLTLYLTGQPARLTAGMAAACSLTANCWLANRWWKVSLHAAFSFFYALLSPNISPALLIPAFILAAAILWSRHHLARHTPRELLAGAALGLLHATPLYPPTGTDPSVPASHKPSPTNTGRGRRGSVPRPQTSARKKTWGGKPGDGPDVYRFYLPVCSRSAPSVKSTHRKKIFTFCSAMPLRVSELNAHPRRPCYPPRNPTPGAP